MQNHRNGALVKFGVFEFRKDTAELKKHGIKIRLQGKPVQLLNALLESPGDVVTREELQKRLWQGGTVVDFESGLNTAANRLRLALGDSAENPTYVETLSRIGYRFIAPVSEAAVQDLAPESPAADPAKATAPSAPVPARPSHSRVSRYFAAGLTVAVLGAIVAVLPGGKRVPAPPSFRQVTFRRMTIGSARFAPDGENVFYEASGAPGQREIYTTHPNRPESRPLGIQKASLASVSRTGELALIYPRSENGRRELVRVPVNAGAPLAVSNGVWEADWSSDGRTMALLRGTAYPTVVEYPRGTIVYTSKGWLSDLRVSPSGRELAFIEHPVRGDDGGDIDVIGPGRKCTTLSRGWSSAWGLAWAPSGKEVWFTAAHAGLNRSLRAVDLERHSRTIATFPGTLTLFDISPAGRVLITRDDLRLVMTGTMPGSPQPRDLSWFDYSHAVAISENGQVLLFDETGEGGGPGSSAYFRRIDAPGATRLGEGIAMAISPDGRWAITAASSDRTSLNLVSLVSGASRTIPGHGLEYDWVAVFPSGDRLLAGGRMDHENRALFTQQLDGSPPRRLKTSTFLINAVIAPDGKLVAGRNENGVLTILDISEPNPRFIETGFPAVPLRWCPGGSTLLVQNTASIPAGVYRVDVRTGKYKLWREIGPDDLAGVTQILPSVIDRDEKAYAFSFNRRLSDLFVVDGWAEPSSRR